MKSKIILEIQNDMRPFLSQDQFLKLTKSLLNSFEDVEVISKTNDFYVLDNNELLNLFLSAKKVEGCSKKTLNYYESTIERMLNSLDKRVDNISTNDIRTYLSDYNLNNQLSKLL